MMLRNCSRSFRFAQATLAVPLITLFSSLAAGQTSCFCEEGFGPDPEGKIEISYRSTGFGDDWICGSEGDATFEICWPTTDWVGGVVPLTPVPDSDCGERNEAEEVLIEVRLTEVTLGTPVWELKINGSTTPFFLDGTCGINTTCSSSCSEGSYEYIDFETEKIINFSVTGECQELEEGQPATCNTDEAGDDDCEGGDESSSDEGPKPVGYLTGDKYERNNDLTVRLPGRDFVLTREYTSDPGYYAAALGGGYYWNGEIASTHPGFIGANWTGNVFSMLTGDLGEDDTETLILTGVPTRTVRKFIRVSDPNDPPVFHAVSSNNQYIISAEANVIGLGVVDVWRVVEPGGVERDFVMRPTNWSGSGFDRSEVVGRLVRERDQYGNEWNYKWFGLYSGSVGETPRLESIHLNSSVSSGGIVTEGPARVDFLWHGQSGTSYSGTGPATQADIFGRLAEVQVIRFDSATEVVTQKVKYTYWDEWFGLQDFGETGYTLDQIYYGSPGDLCEVTTSIRVDNDINNAGSNDDFYDKVYQYRYYDDGDTDYFSDTIPYGMSFQGKRHQLMAVVYPEQIEYFADYVNQLVPKDANAYGLATDVKDAAARLRWIRFDETFDGQFITNAYGLFLPGTYWGSLYQLASKIVSYENSTDRVKMQIVNAGGSSSSCGCSSVGGSQLGKRYDYLYQRYTWSDSVGSPPAWSDLTFSGADGYSCQVVESHMHLNTTTSNLEYRPYRVYSHDYYWPSNLDPDVVEGSSLSNNAGIGVFKVMSVVSQADPDWDFDHSPADYSEDAFLGDETGGGKHWVTWSEYDFDTNPTTSAENDYGKLTARYTPAAMDSSSYVPALYDGGVTQTIDTTSPEIATKRTSQGLVYTYEYANGRLNKTYVQEGENGTAVLVTEAGRGETNDRTDLVTVSKRYAGSGVTEETQIDYDYHTTSYETEVVGSVKETVIRETAAQNGPGSTANPESWRLSNLNGQLVWSIDPDSVLTYYRYDAATGGLTMVVHDADPNGSYVISGDGISNFPSAPTTSGTSPYGSFQELTDEYELDLLGRVVQHTDPSGTETYYRYEYLDTDLPDSTTDELEDRGVPYFAKTVFPYKLTSGDFDGPIRRTWMDTAGNAIRNSSFIASDSGGSYDPLTDTYTLGDEVERSDTEMMLSSVPIRKLDWHNIGTTYVSDGAYETSYEYDSLGRISKVTDPEGGVMQYGDSTNIGYDIFDRPISVFSGTTSGVSLISKTFYDSDETSGVPTATQGVGNGVVRRVESYPGEGNTRVVNRWYDFRDRLIAQENPEAPHQVFEYDNLNRVIARASFTDSIFESGTHLYEPADYDAYRSTYSETLYNNRGMVYRTRTAIDPTLDPAGMGYPGYLESNSWFDLDGNVIASWSPNSAATKYEYDALDRPIVVYQTDRYGDSAPGSGSYAHADDVTGDHIISQTEYSYIDNGDSGAGQVELVTNRMRHHDAKEANTGEVTGALTTSDSVATYTGFVYDDASRQTYTLSYGTNDTTGSDFISATSAPTTPFVTNRSTSEALISSVEFDEWGRVEKVLDPEGKITLAVYDDLSRTIATIENQVDIDGDDISPSSGNWAVAWTGTPPADQDRVTTFWYDGLSNVTKRTAHLNDGSEQVTQYVYGTDLGSSSNTMDSLVRSSTLLAKVHYPNESTGAADTSSAYTVSYAYNRLGELRGTTDQNGTVHKLTRDDLGRITSDEAETLGTNIDGAVREITTSFDAHGRVEEIESLNGSSTVLNGVKFAYTPLHQIEKVYQEHSGSVVTIGGSISEYVQYGYTDAAPSSSGGNYSRITEVYYPSDVGGDETLSYDYTGETDLDVINDRISRIFKFTATSWNPTTPPDLVSYHYLGQGMAAQVAYPTIETLLDSTRGYSGEFISGQYPGYEQYGRRVWHAWVNSGFDDNGVTDNTSIYYGQPNQTPLMARRYAYDAMSNRILDVDGRPGAVAQDRDWEYEYDGLDRLKTATRGLRNSETSPTSVGTIANYSRQWTLDMLGNWNNVITDIDSDGLFEGTDDQEDRQFNAANEVEVRDLPSGSSFGTTSIPMEYDNAGNFRSNEAVGSSDLEYTHDAWNRLVEVEKVLSGGARTAILANEFNGLNWRIARQVDLSKGSYDGLDEKREYFYSAGWQMIEEYVDADNDDDYDPENSDDYMSQQIWGARYIDDAVAKRITDDSTSRSYYYLTDAMFSVRALTDSGGRVVERIDYTPYGVATHSYAGDVNNDGVVNFFDTTPVTTNAGGSPVLVPGDANYDPDVDSNGDGMNFFDVSAFLAQNTAFGSVTNPSGWLTDPTDSSWTDNSIGYDGYHFDYVGATDGGHSGVYHVRHRVYGPGMGGWLERDPIGYLGGPSLYLYVLSNPQLYLDPLGLKPGDGLDGGVPRNHPAMGESLKQLSDRWVIRNQRSGPQLMPNGGGAANSATALAELAAKALKYIGEMQAISHIEDAVAECLATGGYAVPVPAHDKGLAGTYVYCFEDPCDAAKVAHQAMQRYKDAYMDNFKRLNKPAPWWEKPVYKGPAPWRNKARKYQYYRDMLVDFSLECFDNKKDC